MVCQHVEILHPPLAWPPQAVPEYHRPGPAQILSVSCTVPGTPRAT